jgi:hypothetical protein
MIMLVLYNEPLMINHPIGTSFLCGFQLSNKKEFILCLFELPLVDPLTLTIVLSLFNLFIIITSQSSLQHQYHFIICNLYSSPTCGSTPILLGYLLLRHSCTWDKTSIFWLCQQWLGFPSRFHASTVTLFSMKIPSVSCELVVVVNSICQSSLIF